MTVDRQANPAQAHAPRLSYLPGLDGLRAVAVMAVLFYHADYAWLPGGFLGVEVFFVISGYLITSLLIKEWQHNGRIDLPAFWLRRARRLLPALFLLLTSILTVAVIFLPDEVAALRGDVLAASAYITNWYFIVAQKSYFETVGRPPLLQHLWSLAIEEQFYVLWPVLLSLMLRRWRPGRVAFIILAAATASSIWMAVLYQPATDPSRVYYGTDTRAAGLLFGAVLAFLWQPERVGSRLGRWLVELLGVAGLAGLCAVFAGINQFSPALYRGGFAFVALATMAAIAACVHPQGRLGPLVLGRQPLRWIGLRSYGIYLWHWPIYMLTRPQIDVPFDGLPLLALRLALTFILSDLSYRLIETPIRNGALGRAWQALRQTQGVQKYRLAWRWVMALAALLLFYATLGGVVVSAEQPSAPAYLAVASVRTVGSASTPQVIAPEPTASPSPSATPSETATATSTASPTQTATASATPTEMVAEPSSRPAGGTAARRSATATAAAPAASATATTTATASLTATATPSRTATPAPPTPTPQPTCVPVGGLVTAIGDSVMIGAAGELERTLCEVEVDAVQGRMVGSAIDVLRAYKAEGRLGQAVIVHIGNNGVLYASQFDDLMNILADRRLVVLVNVKVPREWEANNNAVIADGVRRYANTVLVDWRSLTARRPDVFWSDGMHLRPEGARYYAGLIADALQRRQASLPGDVPEQR